MQIVPKNSIDFSILPNVVSVSVVYKILRMAHGIYMHAILQLRQFDMIRFRFDKTTAARTATKKESKCIMIVTVIGKTSPIYTTGLCYLCWRRQQQQQQQKRLLSFLWHVKWNTFAEFCAKHGMNSDSFVRVNSNNVQRLASIATCERMNE